MLDQRQPTDSPQPFNGPAPIYRSMIGLMQQNLDLSRDMMRRSLDSLSRLASLPNETMGRIEPLGAPMSAWSDLNRRSIEFMQKMTDQRLDTLQRWATIGFELLEQSVPKQAEAPEEPPVTTVRPMPEKPKRAA
jgi:hypothetical protein